MSRDFLTFCYTLWLQLTHLRCRHRLPGRYLPLIVFEQQPGIATRKHIYKLRGIFDSGHVRHPGAQLSAADAQMIEQLVAETFPQGLSPDAVRRTIDL